MPQPKRQRRPSYLAGALVEGTCGVSGDFSQPTSTRETAKVSNANSFIVMLFVFVVRAGMI